MSAASAEQAVAERAAAAPESFVTTLRKGLAVTPELRVGLGYSALLGLLASASAIAVPIIVQQAIDRAGLSTADATAVAGPSVPQLVLIGAVVVIASRALSVVAQRQMIRRSEMALSNLRERAFDHVHRLPMIDQSEQRTGVLISRITSDVQALTHFIDWGLVIWLVEPILLLSVVAVIAVYSWQFGLFTIAVFIPVAILIRLTQHAMAAAHDGRRTATANVLDAATETLAGAAVIRIHALQAPMRKRLRTASEDKYRAGLSTNVYQAAVYIIGDILTTVLLVSALLASVLFRSTLGLEQGEVIAVLLLVSLMNSPLAELAETWSHTQEAMAGWRKVLGLLDVPAGDLEPAEGAVLPAGPLKVEVTNLSFSYDRDPADLSAATTEARVLDQVSTVLPAGKTVAVVGASGSGKSTFCKLLCRLADPVAGEIRLGGTLLTDVSAESRHQAIRFVPQDGFLFAGTVLNNIAMGVGGERPPADEADVQRVVERLGLGDWLASLPEGLATPVEEQGRSLSVGERQLVGLARAAMADPGLLILDEATSSLDPRTERQLSEAVTRLAADRTLVMIAHRMSTAQTADLVLVFDQGQLVERGHHDQLVAADGVYAELFTAWERESRART